MKISLALAEGDCRTVLRFESGLYDGIPPVSSVFVENRIRRVSADRLAIAGALIARGFIGSEVTFHTPCSPEVAHGLEGFFAPLGLRVANVEFTPMIKPVSERTAVLSLPAVYATEAPRAEPGDVRFGIADDQSFESRLSIPEIQLGTNLRLLACEDRVAMGLGILGLGILFAEDFGIGRFVLPRDLAEDIPNRAALSGLTLHSNIELVIR